jgi:hypothetical protein
MRSILLTTIAALLLAGCSSEKKEDVDLEIVPVRSGKYWGYIDHEGNFKINPQFRIAYAFSEGLALVEGPEGKYGYIRKDGKFAINPVYNSALAFSEGLALVVRENSQLEYISDDGETRFQLPTDIEKAGSFTEGLALVATEDYYGYVNKEGKVAIPLKYVSAGQFSEGLARVASYDSTAKEYKFGFIDKKGELVINYQFARVSDFSEGLALVYNGKQYGYINKKGEFVINPQFESASDFKGDYAIIRQGELCGYIDKKGKIVINAQFKEADYFYDNKSAAVISNEGKFGFIDKDAKFQVNPQFDYLSRLYSGIAVVKMGEKYGLVDDKGKIIVNPQFDNYTVVADERDVVHSDYLDLAGIVSFILKGTDKNRFSDFGKDLSFKQLQARYANLSENNWHEFKDFPAAKNRFIQLSHLNFDFMDLYHHKNNYVTQTVYNPVAGGYEDQQVYNGTTSTFNPDARLRSVQLNYDLRGNAYGKKTEVITELLNKLKGMGFRVSRTEENGQITYLENGSFTIQVNGSHSREEVKVYAVFTEYDEFEGDYSGDGH